MLTGWIFFSTASRVPLSICTSGPAKAGHYVRLLRSAASYVVSAFRRTFCCLGRPLSPAQNPLERKKERSRVLERVDKTHPVGLEECRKPSRRHMSIVLGQERPLHPFHHIVARG